MKGKIRNDSVTARFDVIRLMVSIAAMLRLHFGCMDTRGRICRAHLYSVRYIFTPARVGGIQG